MTTKYRLLPKAEADFYDIYAYTYEKLGENQAEKYTDGLIDTFTLITEHPHIGRDIGYLRTGYFRYECEAHTVYYRQDAAGISIVRILGGKQDPLRHL